MKEVDGLGGHLGNGRRITGAGLPKSCARIGRFHHHAVKVAYVRSDYVQVAIGRKGRVERGLQAGDARTGTNGIQVPRKSDEIAALNGASRILSHWRSTSSKAVLSHFCLSLLLSPQELPFPSVFVLPGDRFP